MTRTLRFPGRLVGAAVIVVAALTASACGQVQAGSAAVVGDRRISVADLQSATTEVEAAKVQLNQRQILILMICEPYLIKAAAVAGVGVSEDEITTELKRLNVAHPRPATVSALRAYASALSLQQGRKQQQLDAALQEIQHAKITVNPRYGRFDAKTLNLAIVTPDWLVTSAPAPAGQSGQSPAPTP